MRIEPNNTQIRLMESGDGADAVIAVPCQNQWELFGFKSKFDLFGQKAIHFKGCFDRVHEVGFDLKTFHINPVPPTTEHPGNPLVDKTQRALSEANTSMARIIWNLDDLDRHHSLLGLVSQTDFNFKY
jgi:hypothetical protein